jgi:hypothetical protein
VAYRVTSIAEAARGMRVLLEPFDVGFAVVGFYQTGDGAVIEFMEYKGSGPQCATGEAACPPSNAS